MSLAIVAATSIPPVKVFGLPLHSLVVHAAVVLVPLVAVGAIVMAFSSRFSRRYGILIVLVAFGALFATVLAGHTGEQLQVALSKAVGKHGTMGQSAKYIVFVFVAFLTGLYYLDWRIGRPGKRKKRGTLEYVVATLTGIAALVSIYWIIDVGHSGAKLVWSVIGSQIHN